MWYYAPMASADDLRSALAPDRVAVERALAAAEQELQELRERQVELELLITQARAVLGIRVGDVAPSGVVVAPVGDMTLHEAMRQVLRSDGPMTSRELADEINKRGLYRQRSGGPVPAGQISARMNRYPNYFKKVGDDLIGLLDQEV